jgi:dienelactone hydrolase
MPQVCGPGVHSRTKAEGLAALGYVAFAGDYYGNGRELDNLPDAVQLAHSLFGDTSVLRRRGMSALNKLASLPQVDSSRLASIGFCMGGNFSLELAREGAPLRGIRVGRDMRFEVRVVDQWVAGGGTLPGEPDIQKNPGLKVK